MNPAGQEEQERYKVPAFQGYKLVKSKRHKKVFTHDFNHFYSFYLDGEGRDIHQE